MTMPRCPYCDAQGLKHLAAKKAGPCLIIYCSQCGAIHGIMPDTKPEAGQKSVGKQTPAAAPAQNHRPKPAFLAELGYIDLSTKEPYSPEKMAARVRAAGRGYGTQYMRIAVDDGPPICLHCQVDMEPETIPVGYPNTGTKVWVCPNYAYCKQWELAE